MRISPAGLCMGLVEHEWSCRPREALIVPVTQAQHNQLIGHHGVAPTRQSALTRIRTRRATPRCPHHAACPFRRHLPISADHRPSNQPSAAVDNGQVQSRMVSQASGGHHPRSRPARASRPVWQVSPCHRSTTLSANWRRSVIPPKHSVLMLGHTNTSLCGPSRTACNMPLSQEQDRGVDLAQVQDLAAL